MSVKKEDDILSLFNTDITDFIIDSTVTEEPDGTKDVDKDKQEDQIDVNNILSADNNDNDGDDDKDDNPDTDSTPAPVINKDISSSSSEPFTLVFARYLLEQGNISNLDEKALQDVIESEGEESALSFLIQSEVDYNKTSILENYDLYNQEYIKMRESGVDPEDAAKSIQSLEQLDSINVEDLEDESSSDLRKQILFANYKATTNFSDDRIKKLIQRSLDLGEDLDDVKEALESLKEIKKEEIENLKKTKITEKLNQEKEVKETISNLKTKINSLDEIVPNLKVSKQSKQKIEELLTKPVKQTDQGQMLNGVWSKRMDNPMDFDIKLAYLIELGAFDGKWDKLIKKTESKITEELKGKMNIGNSFFGGNKPAISKPKGDLNNSNKDLAKLLLNQ